LDYKETYNSQLKEPFVSAELKNGYWYQQLNKGILVNLLNKSQLLIRWMQVDDLPFIFDLEQQIFLSPWTVESFLYEIYNRNYNVSIVGLIEQQLVSYAVSYLICDEMHISNLAVAPKFRRLKIGETMLSATLQIGKEKNCKIAQLEVRKSNKAAISLYQKYGFKLISVRKNYYQKEKEDALLMNRKIDKGGIYGMV